MKIDHPMRPYPIYPVGMPRGQQQFKAESMYKAEFSSDQVTGQVLREKSLEQRQKTKGFGV